MTLREIIIQYREKNGLSQRQFAERCGISNGYISMIETDLNPKTGKPAVPSLRMMRKIAAGMSMSLDELLAAVDELVIDISANNNTASKETAQMKEFNKLFNCLTAEEQKLIIAQMRGILADR